MQLEKTVLLVMSVSMKASQRFRKNLYSGDEFSWGNFKANTEMFIGLKNDKRVKAGNYTMKVIFTENK